MTVQPGAQFYVVREPSGSPARNRTSWIVESRPFDDPTRADSWRDWIATQHPKDAVFVVQKTA